MMGKLRLALALYLFAVPTAFSALAHGDDDHGHEEPAAVTDALPRLQSTGSKFEIVATAKGHELMIYLGDAATNAPISGASIQIDVDGKPFTATAAAEGTYAADVEPLEVPGSKALLFVVSKDAATDLLNGVLVIPSDTHEDDKGTAAASWLSDPKVWGLGAFAGAIGFVLAFAFRPSRLQATDTDLQGPESPASQTHRILSLLIIGLSLVAFVPSRAIAGPGHDHGEVGARQALAPESSRRMPGGDVFMPKATQFLLQVRTANVATTTVDAAVDLIGTVISDPSTQGLVQAPMDGQVELSSRGISYAGQRVKAGEVLALLAPTMPVYDRGALQQLTAEVEGKLIIAEQKLSRLTRIAGVVAQREIDDTKAELDALREQKRVLSPKSAERLELKAPLDGVISVANVRAGQVVTARDTLFEIVDPDRLWVEAIAIPGHDNGDIFNAHAIDADGHVLTLSYVGQAPSLRQQSLLLNFSIKEPHEGLAIGSPVKVIAQRSSKQKGIVVPATAIVRGANGIEQVWIKASPEVFKPSPVKTRPIDGRSVLVLAGVVDGSRVVTDGAELINQVR